jgi:hypothetical protein
MALSKTQIKEIISTLGTTYIEKPATATEISSLRSRLWQAAKRNDRKVSCSIEGERILVLVTPKG